MPITTPNRRTALAWSASTLLAGLMNPPAQAAVFPDKPIRFVVPLAPGGSADLLARQVGAHWQQRWGQPVVIDLRPGGGTVIGSNVVAHANADGYTLLFAANSLAINAKLRTNLPYDGLKAFEPVALMATSPQVLAVAASSPLHSFAQWLQAGRQAGHEPSLCSLGPATTQHMACQQLQHATGTRGVYVPYAGGALAVNAVLGGHVDTVLGNLAEMLAHFEAGTLRPLAVTTAQRLPQLPQVPTVAESGHAGFEAVAWFGVAAPAHTPAAVVATLAEGVQAALADPALQQALAQHGLQPSYLGPQAFAQHVARSFAHYAQVIDEAGITAG